MISIDAVILHSAFLPSFKNKGCEDEIRRKIRVSYEAPQDAEDAYRLSKS